MKISVLVCNYNHGRFLDAALRAILTQTHRDIELIVIDDASTDDSLDVIYHLMDGDGRIRLERNRENQGLLKTFEWGIKLCTGELWMGCGADDLIIDPSFFQSCNALLGAKSEASGVFGISQRINGDTGEKISELGSAVMGWNSPEDFLRGFFERTCFVPGFSVMWRRSMLDEVGGFAMDLGPQFDYWVNHALPSKRGIFFIPEVVCKVRVFSDGSNFSSQKPEERVLRLQRHAQFEKRLVKLTGFDDAPLVAKWRTQLIYDLCDGKDVENGWKTYMEELIKP